MLIRTLAVVLLFTTPVHACMWDSDTIAQEADGLPEIVNIIVGRFPRNPDRYYEMRYQRMFQNIEVIDVVPIELWWFDDIAVACDRLGKHDEAVRYMQRKHELMTDPQFAKVIAGNIKEHTYRYHANIGTFYIHRWLANGADRQDMTDAEMARDHIAKAIEINPDAHFGREKYQLMAIEWILNPPTSQDDERFDYRSFLDHQQDLDIEHAIEGVSGLIVLGAAWESVDVYKVLGDLLGRNGDASLAMLVEQRIDELIKNGRRSVAVGAPTGDALMDELHVARGQPTAEDEVIAFYKAARAAADEWHDERVAFMHNQFHAGKHPDTHKDFWVGYTELPAITLPGDGFFARTSAAVRNDPLRAAPVVLAVCISALLIAIVILRRVARYFTKTSSPAQPNA